MEIILLITLFLISVIVNIIGKYVPSLAIEEMKQAKIYAKEAQPMLLGIAMSLLFKPYTEYWIFTVLLLYPLAIALTNKEFQFHIPLILALTALTQSVEGIILTTIANYTQGLQQTNNLRNLNMHILILVLTIIYLLI